MAHILITISGSIWRYPKKPTPPGYAGTTTPPGYAGTTPPPGYAGTTSSTSGYETTYAGQTTPYQTKYAGQTTPYQTEYAGQTTPYLTEYAGQTTPYQTEYAGQTTPNGSKTKHPYEPDHFKCQMHQSAYTYDSQHRSEFVLKDSGRQDAHAALSGSGSSFVTTKRALILTRSDIDYWFKVVTLSFKVKNVKIVTLVFVDVNKKVIARRKVCIVMDYSCK